MPRAIRGPVDRSVSPNSICICSTRGPIARSTRNSERTREFKAARTERSSPCGLRTPRACTSLDRPDASSFSEPECAWPRNENGWTIVLVSYPKTNGRPAALQTADKGARSGLHQVGVLDSSLYASLQPGYYVVFSGVYPAKSDADAAVATARQAGFGGAYSRQIAR